MTLLGHLPYLFDHRWLIAIAYVVLAIPIILVSWGAYRGIRSVRLPEFPSCAQCGYELRATPDRCPECGTVPPGGERASLK